MDATQRRSLYWLMIVVAVSFMTARVMNVENVVEPSLTKNYGRGWPKDPPSPWPTFASNDRARWATVKALVEERTCVIGVRETLNPVPATGPKYIDKGILFTDGFKSVDVVLHPERQEFYSTKPPLLTLLAAGEYWLLHKFLKWNIDEQRWEVVTTILLTLNVLPVLLMLWLFSKLLEEYGTTDWGKLFTMAAACFGTFLPTFAIALNNHVPASCCIFMAMYLLLRREGVPSMFLAGLFSGFAVCMDLPSAAFAGVGFLLLLMCRTWVHAVLYAVGTLIPMAAQTIVNHDIMGTWLPVYAQFGGPWYEYEGSHWAKRHLIPKPTGIDFIDEPKHVYAFNLLFGHHGLFSLTPIFLLALTRLTTTHGPRVGQLLLRFVPLIVAVVLGFYIWRTNNYGGWSCGPRWLFWLTPLLLLGLIPAADLLSRSAWSRKLAYACLAVSAFSTMFPFANPWRHPWPQQWAKYMGWINY